MCTLAAGLAALVVLLLASCSAPVPVTETGWYLGTSCSLTLYERNPRAVEAVFSMLEDVDARMGVGKAGSEIDAINAAAGRKAVLVSESTFLVVQTALRYAELTAGAFDPTVGPLVQLWGIGTDRQAVPSKSQIEDSLAAVSYRRVRIEPETRAVELLDPSMALDLGAIAKGYAADAARRLLLEHGVDRAIVDFGGNIMTVGTKPDRTPWRIGVQDPMQKRGSYLGILETGESAIVTSGTYERFFEEGGLRYHHILDPATGRPARSGLLSATAVADTATDADALSTGMFVMGAQAGLALAESLSGVEAIFVTEEEQVLMSSGLTKRFRITSDEYALASE
jgi:thiamine biosynthesis lipoprotein